MVCDADRKSKPEGKRIMPETKFTEFPALSVDPRAEIFWFASETDDYFSYLLLEKSKLKKKELCGMMANSERRSAFFVTARKERL